MIKFLDFDQFQTRENQYLNTQILRGTPFKAKKLYSKIIEFSKKKFIWEIKVPEEDFILVWPLVESY